MLNKKEFCQAVIQAELKRLGVKYTPDMNLSVYIGNPLIAIAMEHLGLISDTHKRFTEGFDGNLFSLVNQDENGTVISEKYLTMRDIITFLPD